jgi:signal transduction histidine kinase
MRQAEPVGIMDGTERKRVETVVQTLATLRSEGESAAEVAHDARNMVTALGLYCDLLEEPGVLAAPFAHYGNELRLVAAASRRLVEKLVALDARAVPGSVSASFKPARPASRPQVAREPQRGLLEGGPSRGWELMPSDPIGNLAEELLANRNLMAALAGPPIALTVDVQGGAQPVRLTGEDLTRVLVNLVKNASEAMPAGGLIQVGLRARPAAAGTPGELALTVEDNGPGIPEAALEKIFASGYTTRSQGDAANGGWAAAHRGLGLSITRSIVEAAGGRIHAANRAPSGARFEISLPVRTR